MTSVMSQMRMAPVLFFWMEGALMTRTIESLDGLGATSAVKNLQTLPR
jgi:hypothetical protein